MPVWDYDLISNGGPAGLIAGIYTGRARLHAVRLEKLRHGGPLTDADVAATHPGFPGDLSGFELSERLASQARSTAVGDGIMAALAVARYHEEQK